MTEKLISRTDIEKLVGVSRTKMARIIENKKFKFPDPEESSAHNKFLYDEKKVMAWLNKNDMKKIRVRAPSEPIINLLSLDIRLAQQFLFGKKAAR